MKGKNCQAGQRSRCLLSYPQSCHGGHKGAWLTCVLPFLASFGFGGICIFSLWERTAGASFPFVPRVRTSLLYQLSKGERDIEQNGNKRTLEKKTQLRFTGLYGPLPCWPVSFRKSVLSLHPMQLSRNKPKSSLCLLFTKETNVYWCFLHFLLVVPSPTS